MAVIMKKVLKRKLLGIDWETTIFTLLFVASYSGKEPRRIVRKFSVVIFRG